MFIILGQTHNQKKSRKAERKVDGCGGGLVNANGQISVFLTISILLKVMIWYDPNCGNMEGVQTPNNEIMIAVHFGEPWMGGDDLAVADCHLAPN